MSPAELRLHRRNTKAFIDWDPVTVTLTPVTSERTAAGGTREIVGTPRAPQVFRLLPQSGSGRPLVAATRDGAQREADYVLLGEHGAQVATGDRWKGDDDREWEVMDIVHDNHYETRALVVERGR